jgi:hypothetical protein
MLLLSAMLLTAAAVRAQPLPASASVALSQNGIQGAVEAAVGLLETQFRHLNIDPENGVYDGFVYNASSIQCTVGEIDNATAVAKPSSPFGPAVAFSASKVGLTCGAVVDAYLDVWPHPGCHGTVNASTLGAALSGEVGLTMKAPGIPQLIPGNMSVDLGSSFEWSASLSNPICNALAEFVKTLFSGAVDSKIRSEVVSAFGKFVNTTANNMIADSGLELSLPAPFDQLDVRFNLTKAPVVSTNGVFLSVLGDIVDKADPLRPPLQPPTLPPYDPSEVSREVELLLSPFILESGAFSMEQAGLISFTVSHSLIPSSFPLQLNTTSIGILLAPGVLFAFPNSWFQIQLGLQQGALVAASVSPQEGLTFAAPVAFEFQPLLSNGTTPTAFALGCNLTASILLGAQPGPPPLINGSVTNLACDVSVLSSAVGEVHPSAASDLINLLLKVLVTPAINFVLGQGLPIPTIEGVSLVQPQISFAQGYVLLSTDFDFTPPARLLREML